VVIVALVLGGAGYLIWTERTRIADAILVTAGTATQLNEAAFIADAPRLLRETRADYAMLVETNLLDNVMTEKAGIDTDGSRWVPTIGAQQILVPASSMALLVKFLANEVVCMDTATAVNVDSRALAAKGFARLCFLAVPPILGVNAGALVVAWHTPLLEEAEYRAGIAMKSAALKFATW
jgi:hypothetical protein